MLAGATKAFEQSYTFDLVGNRLRKIIAQVSTHSLPSGWSAGTVKSDYNARDQLLSTVAGAATTKVGYDANGSLTTRHDGSDQPLFRQGYDLKNRLVEADADGDADADLRLAYDHQEGRVARHTLDGSGAVTASEHYLLDRMNPTGYVNSPPPTRLPAPPPGFRAPPPACGTGESLRAGGGRSRIAGGCAGTGWPGPRASPGGWRIS